MSRSLSILFFFIIIAIEPKQSFAQSENSKIDSLLLLTKQSRKDTIKVNILYKLSEQLWKNENYNSAYQYADSSLQLARRLDYFKGISLALTIMGTIHFHQGNYEKAIEKYFQSLKIEEKTGNKKRIAILYSNIAGVFYQQKNYTKAMEKCVGALKLYKEIGDTLTTTAGMLYLNIGLIYDGQAKRDLALENFLKAKNILETINDKYGLVTTYNHIGSNDFYQERYEQALENFSTALLINEEIENKQGMAISYTNIAAAYQKLGRFSQALKEYNKALLIAKEINNKEGIKIIYEGLSELYFLLNDYRSAYEYHLLYSQIKDSLLNAELAKNIVEMQAKHDMEKKEKELTIQSLKISEQELQLNKNKILQLFLLAGIIFIIIISFLLFNRYKIKQQERSSKELLSQQKEHTKAIIETQEQERARIARDLHDSIGQTLAGIIVNHEQISNNLHLLSEEKQKIFLHTANSLDHAYKELRSISHQMMPRAIQVAGLPSAISDLLDKTFGNTPIKYKFEERNVGNIPENIAVGIYRIFQELLNNIIKHSHANEIFVQLLKNQEQLILIIEDNGIGIKKPDTNKHTGIGLLNITARTQSMYGTFFIESGSEHGTVATVIIPLQTTDEK